MAANNLIVVIGRVGADPTTRTAQSGSDVTTFRMAVQRSGKDKDTADWFEVTTFGRTAEVASKYLRKGGKVAVTGACQVEEWTGKDGTKRTTVRIIANDLHLLGDGQQQGQTGQRTTTNRYDKAPDKSPWDDDIPAF